MSDTVYKVSGEVGKVFQFTVKDSGVAVDLTGATVNMLVKNQSTATCVLFSAASGRVDYTTTASDYSIGTYIAQLKISTAGGGVFYSDSFSLAVRALVT